jgi:hypothetical protein
MPRRYLPSCLIFLFLILSIAGCYDLYYRPQDEKNIRRQFRIPRDVPFASFDSNPKEAGWFGREGLSIQAVFQFSDGQFRDYLDLIEDESAWKPVPFAGYSPKLAHEYLDSSLRWFELPYPEWMNQRLRYWPHLEDVSRIRRGLYHCLVVTVVAGESMKQNSPASSWKYVGQSCCEVSDVSPVILTFGVLDFDTRRLYAYISFGA